MKKGFYTIIATQFFSSLADNALLIAAIALLQETMAEEASWMSPLLKWMFTLSYVLFAAFVGAFADAMPKGRVMLISNTIKIVGCIALILGSHPLLGYGIVGIGAAMYSPAKYGILTELLPPSQLVTANSWIEGATVLSIILGTVMGGLLLVFPGTQLLTALSGGVLLTTAKAAMVFVMGGYLIATVFNLFIPNTGVDHRIPSKNPIFMVQEFARCCTLLWRDKLGQISLATTTIFWGAGATLQFIVLDWAAAALGYSLSEATKLQGVFAIGVALGAVFAARAVSLRDSVKVLPLGALMGLSAIGMVMVNNIHAAVVLLLVVGAMAGFFIVPMNALLQHRGHVLMGAGHSIAVQNFNENIGIMVMLAVYSLLISCGVHIYTAILIYGAFLFSAIILVMLRHRYNQAKGDSLHLIGIEKPGSGDR